VRKLMSATDLAHFEARYLVEPNSYCWLWLSTIHDSGYGLLWRNGKHVRAHRVSYEHFVGPIPEGLHVCHRCDVPCCVNPDHLFLGTHCDNMRDMASKARASHGERRPGARLTADDVLNIRRSAAAGVSQASLARKYCVSEVSVSRIVRRKAWRHVRGAA
jgi:hypothetical protein